MQYSFVTTCQNRTHDLKVTLPLNLRNCPDNSEVVVLDYNSQDDLWPWLHTFKAELDSGKLRIFAERAAGRFLRCHAKNIVHLLSKHPVLVNVDADNMITPTYIAHLSKINWPTVGMVNPMEGKGGWRGRVVVRADVFRRLGGHDEKFIYGYGYEEIDLYRRAQGLGIAVKRVPVDPASVITTSVFHKSMTQMDKAMTIQESNKRHTRMSNANCKNKKYVANAGIEWGSAKVLDRAGNEHLVGVKGPLV